MQGLVKVAHGVRAESIKPVWVPREMQMHQLTGSSGSMGSARVASVDGAFGESRSHTGKVSAVRQIGGIHRHNKTGVPH